MKLIDNWIRSFLNEAIDKAITRLARDQYTENIAELLPSVRKVGGVNLLELLMRSAQGIPVSRPLGSYLQFSPWDRLLFNPVHLHRMPTPDDVGIGTAVTIGRRARRPLTIAIPVMIAAMSFGGALSKRAKVALARAATAVGTATNTGETGLMEEERQAAQLLIGQYNRGGWMHDPANYSRLDAIEIQLGQGAQGPAPQRTHSKNIGQDYRDVIGVAKGEDAVIHSRLPDVQSPEDFVRLVRRLQAETGVPVGLKIGASHHLEQELAIALSAGVDFLTIDGAEGGTHGGAPTLQDDLGLPTLYAVTRAAGFLARHGTTGDVSLIATGGLVTPGQMLKALALGANAVYIGTAAVMALIGDQGVEAAPFEPPTSLVVYTGKLTEQLDEDRAAMSLQRFLCAAVTEMEMIAVSLGRTALSDISKSDLCTLDPDIARATGLQLGLVSPAEQFRYGGDSQFPALSIEWPTEVPTAATPAGATARTPPH